MAGDDKRLSMGSAVKEKRGRGWGGRAASGQEAPEEGCACLAGSDLVQAASLPSPSAACCLCTGSPECPRSWWPEPLSSSAHHSPAPQALPWRVQALVPGPTLARASGFGAAQPWTEGWGALGSGHPRGWGAGRVWAGGGRCARARRRGARTPKASSPGDAWPFREPERRGELRGPPPRHPTAPRARRRHPAGREGAHSSSSAPSV